MSTTETKVDLMIISVADLCFKADTQGKDIYARAQELGLELCPPEVGPQLRLQYKDQPEGDRLYIAMKPIVGVYDYPEVFRVEHEPTGLWLDSGSDPLTTLLRPDERLVFIRPNIGTRNTALLPFNS